MKLIWVLVLVFFTSFVYAQETTFSGVVTDNENKTLEGANIIIQELNIGTISNSDGSFSIPNISQGEYTVISTYVGYSNYSNKLSINNQSQNITISLKPVSFELKSVNITASRIKKNTNEIPGRINQISKKEIESYPVYNTDDILRTIANVNVNRSWGIFSKNSSVTMRGLEGSARTLILLDGAPMNKSAGGSVNWHMINPHNIDKIEITKGPASALYGNNAMAGVINIITQTPKEKFGGNISTQIGSYNTLGSNITLNSNTIEGNKGFYWNVNSFYRQGDGYIYEPFETRDSTDKKLFLKEFSTHIKSGYQFNKHNKITLNYSVYNDQRGDGTKVYENDGSYYALKNHYANIQYSGKVKDIAVEVLGFYQYEDYLQFKESLNSYGEYKQYESRSFKNDIGLWTSFGKQFSSKHNITGGFDFKLGDVDSDTYYKTSTDILEYDGNLFFYALFLQHEFNIILNKLKLVSGIRYDHAAFYNGQLNVQDPTSNTGFDASTFEKFDENSWYSISPKIALKYFVNEKISAYFSVSSGFMPPKLDDLCKSGKIRKGFKLANPELNPEKIVTTELGNTLNFKNYKIESAVYYSLGSDFQYLVGTGDFVEPDGSDPRPVYKRQNISKVEIIGGEISFNYHINNDLQFTTNYAYNHSIIKDYDAVDTTSNNLSGKDLMEVSPHTFYAGINFTNKYVNTNLSYNFIDEQWGDDENTILVDRYSLFNVRLYKTLFKKMTVSLDIQNILDKEFIDRKGRLSPGRFTLFGVSYKI